jgi:hypothetical protein
MLDAFIIEELKRREEARRRQERRPTLELPLDEDAPDGKERSPENEGEKRSPGVIIIDYGA